MRGNNGVLVITFLILCGLLCSLYIFLPGSFNSIDDRVRDVYFKIRGQQKASKDIIIIDIDEKSIAELGQWPWERDKVATLLSNLTKLEAGIIGLDIVFAEADKTSPKRIAKLWDAKENDLPDYDKILAKSISSSPSVVGYIFSFDKNSTLEPPSIPAIFIEKNLQKRDFLPVAKGILTNIPTIQQAAYSSGFLNNIPDSDGIIRSVPLFIKYDDSLYSSLAFEMYRLIFGAEKAQVIYSKNGVENITIEDKNIPSDRFGRLYINFRGAFKSYKYISAVDIIKNRIDKSEIEGKIVLIGTSAYGLMDLRSTPMENVIAGVEIHANAIDNLINNDMLFKPSWIESVDLLMIIFICFMVLIVYVRFPFSLFIVSYIFTFLGVIYLNFYLLFTKYIVMNAIFPIISMILSLTFALAIKFLHEYSQKQLIKNKFSKKVSKAVAESLIKQGDKDILEAKEKEISIFFSDIRGFTSISEELADPKKLINFLNLYMTPMTEIITKNQGTVDKFIGDAIMAYWNAPLDIKDHADRAVQSAIEQIQELKKLNIYLKEQQLPRIDIGIGINSGLAVVGEMGSRGRSDYTIIGDSVNLGSRLEGLCKPYGVKIIISEYAKERLKKEYSIRKLDKVRVKGKKEPVLIYEVLTYEDSSVEEFEKAFGLYEKGFFNDALTLFKDIYKKDDTMLHKLYITRCEHFIQNPPDDFDGVFVFTTK